MASASSSSRKFLSFILCILCLVSISAAAAAKPGTYGAVSYPIYKDTAATQLYYTTLEIGTPAKTANFTLTLGSQLLWYICQMDNFTSTTYRPVPCQIDMCSVDARSFTCHSCDEAKPRPGCTNNTCAPMTYNPFDDVISAENMYLDALRVPSRKDTVRNFPFLCAGYAFYYMNGLPKSNKGMLGLARSNVALPAAVSSALKLPKVFALCLPSQGTGKLLVGGGPYTIQGKLMETDILINNYSTAPIYGSREDSYEYFLGVRSIKVAGVPVKLNSTLLSFGDLGHGGTKLSTTSPYTVLQTDIYKPVVDAFFEAATGMNMKRVQNVGNFTACFSTESIKRGGNNGPAVPEIDLVLQNDNVNWRFSRWNLMVEVSKGVTCLGVVDGGAKPMTAVVIGGLQMEENLVEIDLPALKLRFSSSLLEQNTSCSKIF